MKKSIEKEDQCIDKLFVGYFHFLFFSYSKSNKNRKKEKKKSKSKKKEASLWRERERGGTTQHIKHNTCNTVHQKDREKP